MSQLVTDKRIFSHRETGGVKVRIGRRPTFYFIFFFVFFFKHMHACSSPKQKVCF